MPQDENRIPAYCHECKYWFEQLDSKGDCKRFPPVFVGETGQGDEKVPDFEWPITRGTEWCGEGKKSVVAVD